MENYQKLEKIGEGTPLFPLTLAVALANYSPEIIITAPR